MKSIIPLKGELREIIAIEKGVLLHKNRVHVELALGLLELAFTCQRPKSTYNRLSKLLGKKIAILFCARGHEIICGIRSAGQGGCTIQVKDVEEKWR